MADQHKILRQVMQLGFGDADTAYRLQDRISTLQRNQLEQVIERVLNEFSLPGYIVRINTLELDLGIIEDADIEILLPAALERALRDELGQLMVRRQYDPMVETEALPIQAGGIEDWLYYLEHGIRRWHDTQGDALWPNLFQTADVEFTAEHRSRLVALLYKPYVVERLLREMPDGRMPALLALLLAEQNTPIAQWLAQAQKHALGSASFSSAGVGVVLAKQLVRAWATSGFSATSAEKAKAIALRQAEIQLQTTLQSPIGEQEGFAANALQTQVAKVLQYLLFYGYWPATVARPPAGFNLGEYILQGLQEHRADTINALQTAIAYATARQRLVLQLNNEQLAAIIAVAFPMVERAVAVFNSWLLALPQQLDYFTTPEVRQAVWLQLLSYESQTNTGDAVAYENQLASIIAEVISPRAWAVLQQQVKTPTTGVAAQQVADATNTVDAFSQMVLQWYQKMPPLATFLKVEENTSASLLTDQPASYIANNTQQVFLNLDKPAPADLQPEPFLTADSNNEAMPATSQDPLEASRPMVANNIEASNELLASKLLLSKLLSLSVSDKTGQIDNGLNTQQPPDDAAQSVTVPKSLLQAFVYFLQMGVWPTVIATGPIDGIVKPTAAGSGLAIPEEVLQELLQNQPLAVLSAIYPLLASSRVRERMVYQLSNEALQGLVSAFANLHSPVAQLQLFYQQLTPIAQQFSALSKEIDAPPLASAPALLNGFLLALLYDELPIYSLDAFIRQFVTYWQQTSAIKVAAFVPLLESSVERIQLPAMLKPVFIQALQGLRSPQESENIITEPNAAMALLLGEEDLDEAIVPATTPMVVDALLPDSLGQMDAASISAAPSDAETTPKHNSTVTQPSIASNSPENREIEPHGHAIQPSADFVAKTKNTLEDNASVPMDLPNDQLSQSGPPASGAYTGIEVDTNRLAEANVPESNTTLGQESSNPIATQPGRQIAPEEPESVGEQTAPSISQQAFVLQRPKEDTPLPSIDIHQEPINNPKASNADPQAATDGQPETISNKTTGSLPPADDAPANSYVLSAAAALPFTDSQTLMEQEAETEDESEAIIKQAEQKTLKQKIAQITRGQKAQSPKQTKVLPPGYPLAEPTPQAPLGEPVFIENAGLVLVWPFIGRCFSVLGFTEKGLFKDVAMASRAIHLLQYIATGEEQAPEYLLVLNKILCGMPVFEAVERDVILTSQEKDEADAMLRAVIGNWEKMSKLSVPAFRDSFLKRGGKLTENEVSWTLRVDQVSYDMLLDTLPWTLGMIKLRYMEKVLYVEWR